jgi:hypothetical protein
MSGNPPGSGGPFSGKGQVTGYNTDTVYVNWGRQEQDDGNYEEEYEEPDAKDVKNRRLLGLGDNHRH